MWFGFLIEHLAIYFHPFLKRFLGIVPGTTGIILKHSHQHTTYSSTRKKTAYGFRTGDMVTATVPAGKNKGVHKGRVAVRMTGNFNIQSGIPGAPTVQGISYKHCRVVQRADGYGYVWQATPIEPPQARAATASRSAPFLTALKDGVSRSKI